MGAGAAKIASGIVGTVGAVWQFGAQVAGAWGSYYQTKANSAMQRINAGLMRYNAKSHLESAESNVEYAGNVQQAGEEEAVNRYFQLGQDIGHIYAGAAGGNIDVASRSVSHVDSAARLMAGRDVAAMNRSTQQAANQYIDEAKNARMSYISDMTAAKMQEIQASYNNKIAKSNARLQTWSAAGSLMTNIASAWG
jgi:hypothetical protein